MQSRTTKASIRNTLVSLILTELFEAIDAGQIAPDVTLMQQIEVLFNTQAWGFREIVLVICIAQRLDSTFRASTDFYACNPRTLYEKPIREELDRRGIPSRQSGPLNVAKGAKGINDQWAAGREPRPVANQVVSFVDQIEHMDRAALDNFTKLLLSRFLQERKIVEQLNVQAKPSSDAAHLYRLCETLIDTVPDGGNTPQRIVGYLLESYHEELQTGLIVSGHTDRASTTNTTSKKLGDITEEQIGGLITSAYEVTVKSFGRQRVREAYEAAQSYLAEAQAPNREIVVICRKKDVHPDVTPISNTYLGRLEYQDITFYFVDIYEWITAQLLRMTADARAAFFTKLQNYIADKNTSAKVKMAWATINQIDTATQ